MVYFFQSFLPTKRIALLAKELPDYPASMMSPRDSVQLTLQCASLTPRLIARVAHLNLETSISHKLISYLPLNSREQELVELLAQSLAVEGSDKATTHDYHLLYAKILNELLSSKSNLRLFEIGMGTNNPLIPSTMGFFGKPGASVRAWAKLPFVEFVLGADIDETIKVDSPKVRTFQLDQLDQASWQKNLDLLEHVGPFDLIIDDGLHAFAANLMVIENCIDLLSPQGMILIEDVSDSSLVLWTILKTLTVDILDLAVYKGKAANCITIQKCNS
jgi:hypothetical protein